MKRIYLAVLWIAVQTTMLTAAPPQYELIDIGLTNYDSSQATRINNKGQICGLLTRNGVTNVFIWDPLLNLKYTHIRANSKPVINNRTEIFGTQELRIGSLANGYDQDSIYKWNRPLGYFTPFNIQSLGFPSSQKSSPLVEKRATVWDVNSSRQVIVMNHTAINLPDNPPPEGGFRVWVYQRGKFERIDNARFLMGFKINNKSQVLGCFFGDKPGPSNDKRYMTSIYDLKNGTTRVLRFPAENLGVDINNKGEVAGTYYNPTANVIQGFLGDPSEDCDIIDDFEPTALSNRREMVGKFLYQNKDQPAIWIKHHLYALSDVVSKVDNQGKEWDSLDSLVDINDYGDIIGEGMIDGMKHSFLLKKIKAAANDADEGSEIEVEVEAELL